MAVNVLWNVTDVIFVLFSNNLADILVAFAGIIIVQEALDSQLLHYFQLLLAADYVPT